MLMSRRECSMNVSSSTLKEYRAAKTQTQGHMKPMQTFRGSCATLRTKTSRR